MSKKDKWEAGFAYQDKKDPVFYHADVICSGTVRVAESSGVGKEQAEILNQLNVSRLNYWKLAKML